MFYCTILSLDHKASNIIQTSDDSREFSIFSDIKKTTPDFEPVQYIMILLFEIRCSINRSLIEIVYYSDQQIQFLFYIQLLSSSLQD